MFTVGYGWCFTIDAVTYVAVLIGLWKIDPTQLRVVPLTVKAKGQVRAGLRYARSKVDIWIPFTVLAIVGLLAYNFQVVLPLLVTQTYHGSEGTFTVLYSVFSIGSLTGALSAARRTNVSMQHGRRDVLRVRHDDAALRGGTVARVVVRRHLRRRVGLDVLHDGRVDDRADAVRSEHAGPHRRAAVDRAHGLDARSEVPCSVGSATATAHASACSSERIAGLGAADVGRGGEPSSRRGARRGAAALDARRARGRSAVA